MYCILVDIPAFRQFSRTHPMLSRDLLRGIEGNSRDSGGSLTETQTGRWMISYRNIRSGDNGFMVDAFLRLEEIITGFREQILGFTMLMEIVDDTPEAQDHLRNLVLGITEPEGAWIGEVLAAQLSSMALLERRGRVWKIGQRFASRENHETSITGLIEKLLPSALVIDHLEALRISGGGCLCIESEHPWTIGNLVERSLARFLGKRFERSYLWIRGVSRDEAPQLCLSRGHGASLLDALAPYVDEDNRRLWERYQPFLDLGMQGAWGGEKGRSQYRGLYYPLENLSIIWPCLLHAFRSYASDHGISPVIYLENAEAMPPESLEFLRQHLFGPINTQAPGPCVIITQPEASLRESPQFARGRHVAVQRLSASRARSLIGQSPGCDFSGVLDPGTIAQLVWLKQYHEFEAGSASPLERSIHGALLASLDDFEREVYGVLVLTRGLMPRFKINDFLISYGLERVRIPGIFEKLFQCGLIKTELEPVPVYPHTAEFIEDFLDGQGEVLKHALATFILESVRKGECHVNHDLFTIMPDLLPDEDFLSLAFAWAERLLDTQDLHSCAQVLGFMSARASQVPTGQLKERYLGFCSCIHVRTLMVERKFPELKGAMAHLEQLKPSDPRLMAYIELQRARWYYVQSEYEQAMQAIKRSIMGFQELDDPRGLSNSQIVFGLVLLARERIVEARDYFVLARNSASNSGELHDEMLAAYYDLVILFIQGFHSRVLSALDDPRGIVDFVQRYSMKGLDSAIHILRGRIMFELGRYPDAMEAFTSALQSLAHDVQDALRKSLRFWIERCQARTGPALPSYLGMKDHTAESRFFLVEYRLGKDDFEGLIPLLEGSWEAQVYVQVPGMILASDCHGAIEGLMINGRDKLQPLQGLTQACLAFAGASLYNPAEACETLSKLTRSKNLSQSDPNLYLYYYLYSLVLRMHGGAGDDADTILGKAVKYFQERGSKIEDPAHKQSFFRIPRWNSALLADARQRNLA